MYKSLSFSILLAIIAIAVSSCGLTNSRDIDDVFLELDAFVLTEEEPLNVTIFNLTAEEVFIYKESVNSSIQRMTESGNWMRLYSTKLILGEPMTVIEYFTPVFPNDAYKREIKLHHIEELIDITNNSAGAGESREIFSIVGEYRFVFELVFNEEYENKQRFYSDSFVIE